MRALILDAHSRAAVETIQSLGRAHVAVDAASPDLDCLGFHSRYVERKLVPRDQSGNFSGWLRSMHSEHKYDLIVPSTEVSLRQMMQIEEEEEVRRRAVLASNSSLEIALSKQETCLLAA